MAFTAKNCICLFLSFIGIILGFSAFCTLIFYNNFEAGVLAFISGVFAWLCFWLDLLICRDRTTNWYAGEHFRCFQLFSFIGILIGASSTIWFTFAQVYFKTPIMPVRDSDIIRLVWAFMTLKWSIRLYFSSRHLSRITEDEDPLLQRTTQRWN